MTRSSAWSVEAVDRTVAAFSPLADVARAEPMQRYMKAVAPFLGLTSPVRRSAQRTAWKGLDHPAADDLTAAATQLFDRPEREYHYAAIELVGRYVRPKRSMFGAEFIVLAEQLITTKSWWDSVDAAHSDIVGPLVARHRELVDVMRTWNASDNRWLVRSSIIHQLGYGEATDVDLLFEFCANRAADTEFFIAKAIGWALRDYSYTNAAAVTAFVAQTPLRPLSVREGLKAIERSKARQSANVVA